MKYSVPPPLREKHGLKPITGFPFWDIPHSSFLIVLPSSPSVQFSHSIVSDSATSWTAACQASLSFTNSRSLLKLMSIELVVASNHLILCCPLLLLPSITSWQIDGEKVEAVRNFILGGSKITADGDCSYETRRRFLFGSKAMTDWDSILKCRDITLPTTFHIVKAVVFFSSQLQMWELDHKEGWAPKNWYFWTVVLEKTLESPLDCKELQPVHPEGNQSWIFTGRTDAEAETLIHWSPDGKSQLIGKDPDAGKDCRWEKGTTENQMVGWHHQLDGHEFEQALGVGDGTAVHGVARSWTWLSNELNSLRGVCPYIPRAHWVVGGLLMGRLCLVIGPYGVIIPSSHRGWGIVILSFFVLSFLIIIFQRNFSYIFVKEILVL